VAQGVRRPRRVAVEQAIFNEEIVRAQAPPLANVLGLAMGGPDGHRHRHRRAEGALPPADPLGEEIWCQGFSEPESGSDLASLKTTRGARRRRWVVTGQKVWTTLAHHSKWCMLVARTDLDVPKHKGLTYFLMDMEQDAVQVRPLRQITGEPEFNELFLEEARIPTRTSSAGRATAGRSRSRRSCTSERRSPSAFRSPCRSRARADGEGPLQPGQRGHGSQDPIIRQRLASSTSRPRCCASTPTAASPRSMKYGVPGPEGSLASGTWSEVNQSLTELALDIAGRARSSTTATWTYRFLRARANSIEGGTTEILKNIVAERVLGLPRLR
jgi:alkylation response protein AidB-like acyl-CoA dehydrogenase